MVRTQKSLIRTMGYRAFRKKLESKARGLGMYLFFNRDIFSEVDSSDTSVPLCQSLSSI
jgi:hypothetical protein